MKRLGLLRAAVTMALGFATTQPSTPAIAEPSGVRWLRMPNGDDMAADWPTDHSVEAGVLMHCKVETQGKLKDCSILEEFPKGKGFGAATLRVSRIFRSSPLKEEGEITMPIIWRLPGRIRKEPPIATNPQWSAGPSKAEIAAAFPTAATSNVEKGVVTLRCFALSNGELQACRAMSATPAHEGFEDAALSLAGKLRVDTEWRAQIADLLEVQFLIGIPKAESGLAPSGQTPAPSPPNKP